MVREGLIVKYIVQIDINLKENFGNKVLKPHNDPVGELVRTILSQNTSDTNRDKAYNRLRKRFPNWEQIPKANTSSIMAAIEPGGLSAIKAPRIKKIMQEISHSCNGIDLSHLKKMPSTESLAYLMAFNGVGYKTAACVLLFSFGIKVFPVDTHIYRVAQRMGLIPKNCGRDKAFEILNQTIPKRLHYRLHLNIIELGRMICRPKKPTCGECVLSSLCPSAFSFR
ncbi:MAG: Fe-S cluster assembly protein HesB [candidate division Zixibacteria bacterium CG_4_9_14_3_um_filter_46_8]|nr:MAG: Fe-S cluster assembly protein HesB [candidate division Zixibacteria bacterium CG_4_9_14_3_um_filter_46_8]